MEHRAKSVYTKSYEMIIQVHINEDLSKFSMKLDTMTILLPSIA